MIIDGIEYIKKEEVKVFKIRDYMISDPANVMAIVPIEENTQDLIKLEGFGEFMKYHGDVLFKGDIKTKFKPEKFLLSKSTYSYEFLDKMIKISKIWNNYDTPEFYMWTEKDLPIKENQPVLIKFGNLIFLLAPRIESE